MSDEDRDVDIESDDDDDCGDGSNSATQFMTQAEKRAHHNALERKRRDHIKESFHSLRDSIPTAHGEKVRNRKKSGREIREPTNQASRAQILKQATDYISYMSKKNGSIQGDIEDLKKQNTVLEQQVRSLEKTRATGTFAAQSSNSVLDKKQFDEGSASASDSSETDPPASRRKKPKLK